MNIKKIIKIFVVFVFLLSSFWYGASLDKKDLTSVISISSEITENVSSTNTSLLLDSVSNQKTETETEKSFLVKRVVDGDTIVVLDGDLELKIRLIGVNTPETVDPRTKVECFGKEASSFLKKIMEGKMVYLESDLSQGDKDRYNRLLRYVYLDDVLVNKKIIEEGYGYEYTYKTPYKFQKEFKLAQSQAKENQLGLWKNGVCDNI